MTRTPTGTAETAAETARGDTGTAPFARSTGELVGELSEQVSRLVRDEVRLAWREVQRKGAHARTGAGLFGAAGVLAVYGGGAVLAGLVLLLAMVLPAWLAALAIGGGLLLVAALTALVGRSQLRRAAPPVPDRAVASVREDLAVIRQRARPEREATGTPEKVTEVPGERTRP